MRLAREEIIFPKDKNISDLTKEEKFRIIIAALTISMYGEDAEV